MKRTVLAALLAAGAVFSAQASAAAWGDENDLSWLPRANASQEAQVSTRSNAVTTDATAKPSVRFGDENDTSWLYRPAGR